MRSSTRTYVGWFLAAVAMLGIAACSKTRAGATAASAATGSSVRAGSVAGRLPTNGAVEQGEAIVVLQSLERVTPALPLDIPVINLEGAAILPAVLIVRTGQRVEFRNHDEPPHTVAVKDAETHVHRFNVAVPAGGVYAFPFDRDGFFDVECDGHQAKVFATRSPYAVIADKDGTFKLDDVEPGLYAVQAHAGADELTYPITVKSGGHTEIDLSYANDLP
jgi:hypothetical protein